MTPLQLALEMARQAGALQLAHMGKPAHVEMKGVADPVTDVDRACEQLILDGIRKNFPDHKIIAEEGGTGAATGDWTWIVDPIDGTVNFAHGYPLFCTCIALCRNGRPELGVIYEPNHDEMFVAERGKGSTCNDRPMRVTARSTLIDCVLATGFAYVRERAEIAPNVRVFSEMLYRTQAVRRDGVAGVDLAYVALGRFDGFWEYNLKSWDIAAGSLLIEEAGGRVTMVDGTPLDLFGTEIVATNGIIHDNLCQVIRDNV